MFCIEESQQSQWAGSLFALNSSNAKPINKTLPISLLFLQLTQLPTSGHLHLLFPLPECSASRSGKIPRYLLGLNTHLSWEGPSLTAPSTLASCPHFQPQSLPHLPTCVLHGTYLEELSCLLEYYPHQSDSPTEIGSSSIFFLLPDAESSNKYPSKKKNQ